MLPSEQQCTKKYLPQKRNWRNIWEGKNKLTLFSIFCTLHYIVRVKGSAKVPPCVSSTEIKHITVTFIVSLFIFHVQNLISYLSHCERFRWCSIVRFRLKELHHFVETFIALGLPLIFTRSILALYFTILQ